MRPVETLNDIPQYIITKLETTNIPAELSVSHEKSIRAQNIRIHSNCDMLSAPWAPLPLIDLHFSPVPLPALFLSSLALYPISF